MMNKTQACAPLRLLLPNGESRATRSLRVSFYTAPQAMQHPGGGEVQLLKTAQSLRELAVDVRLFDPWSDRLEHSDWLHLFGTVPECLGIARTAHRLGVQVALSPISWYDPRASWSLEPGLVHKLRGIAAWSARRLAPSLSSWRRELIQAVDLLLPNSDAEARQLERLFQADPDRIEVVHNGVDGRFEHATPTLFHSQFGVRDFVLAPGRIEPRKNQLAIIQALWGSGVPLVVLGDPHPDHAEYYDQCRSAADTGVTFIGRLAHESPLLASAYAAARVVVLASWFETPGLAALEGALAGAQLVVTRRGSAREYFGDLVGYVEPDDRFGIRSSIRDALARPRSSELRQHVRRHYLWQNVARQTLAAYERCAEPRPSCMSESMAAAA